MGRLNELFKAMNAHQDELDIVRSMFKKEFEKHIKLNTGQNAIEVDGTIYPVAHEQSKLFKGKKYAVFYVQTGKFETEWIPIIPIIHRDDSFQFPWDHVHIDARFEEYRAIGDMKLSERTNQVIIVSRTSHDGRVAATDSRIIECGYKIKECLRKDTGLDFQNLLIGEWMDQNWFPWQKQYIGHQCKGKRCPHFGTTMIEKDDGTMECPLHGLVADRMTERIIERHFVPVNTFKPLKPPIKSIQ